jgi:hypothetical protein
MHSSPNRVYYLDVHVLMLRDAEVRALADDLQDDQGSHARTVTVTKSSLMPLLKSPNPSCTGGRHPVCRRHPLSAVALLEKHSTSCQ